MQPGSLKTQKDGLGGKNAESSGIYGSPTVKDYSGADCFSAGENSVPLPSVFAWPCL
jgi:hypothetical protein